MLKVNKLCRKLDYNLQNQIEKSIGGKAWLKAKGKTTYPLLDFAIIILKIKKELEKSLLEN
jgi:hypothetical protein